MKLSLINVIINRFFQWLWIDKFFTLNTISYRPQFKILKTLSPLNFIVRREIDLQEIGFRVQLFTRSLVMRFFYSWIIRKFSDYYYSTDVWIGSWMGTRILKAPTDLFIYQEIIAETKPDVIIECGTANGGTTIFLAHLCDILGNGRIATIDISPEPHPDVEPGLFRPYHDRILYIVGDDTSKGVISILKNNIEKDETVMVILDSNHVKEHVLKELKLYSELVTPGQYLIVEDTNLGIYAKKDLYKNNGPIHALKEWLIEHPEFRIDYGRERHLLTFNPCGYLKRI